MFVHSLNNCQVTVVTKNTCILYKQTEKELKDIYYIEKIRYLSEEVRGNQRVLHSLTYVSNIHLKKELITGKPK